jgi:hypothetical protein
VNDAAIGGDGSRREALPIIVIPVKLHPDSKLAQVADTLNSLSGNLAPRKSRQKQC